jgi:hypothetical protein
LKIPDQTLLENFQSNPAEKKINQGSIAKSIADPQQPQSGTYDEASDPATIFQSKVT